MHKTSHFFRVLNSLFGALVLLLSCGTAYSDTDLTHMRAVHFTGNWAGNVDGIRSSVSSAATLTSAKPLFATSTQTSVTRSSYVNASGQTFTNDIAQVLLSGVTLGTASLAKAGFWVGRDATTHKTFIQFRPSLDPSLAGIDGFSGDVDLPIPQDGSSISLAQLSKVSGIARDFVLAVLANSGDLVENGSFSLHAPSIFSKSEVVDVLQGVVPALQLQQEAYWNFLKTENVEWIGISVAIFSGKLSDPTVQLKYRPSHATDFEIYTFDDGDLIAFITRAKQLNFKVYLTLAFEPSNLNLPQSQTDPTCNTDQYTANRIFFGSPTLTSDPNERCINPAFWWWNPSHPDHADNVAKFWNTYTQIAVKYATLSQELGVEMYSLGTETERLFRTRPSKTWSNNFNSELTAMVSAVRNVYSGLLSYDQHFSVLQYPHWQDDSEGSKHIFTDLALDVVSISAYFELANAPVSRVLSVNELEFAWDRMFQQYLVPLQAQYPGKPIIFAEFGYTDDVASPAAPAVNQGKSVDTTSIITDGMRQQQNIFQAFFNVNAQYDDLVQGAFLWGNSVFTNYKNDCDDVGFNLYCKASAQTIASIYGQWLTLDANRVFAWAEGVLPQYFPAGSTTQQGLGYIFRYYPSTQTYLGFKDGRAVVHNGRNWKFQDVGSMRQYLDQAAGAGF